MSTLEQRLANLTPAQRDALMRKLERPAAAPAPAPPLPPREDRLSPSQQRMWLFEKIEGNASAYNIASVLRLRGALDVDALEWAINDIVRRHESLRTTFVEIDGQARQQVAERLELRVERREVAAGADGDLQAALQAAIEREIAVDFALDRGPLLRVSVLGAGPGEQVLVAVIHHIIADGWSLRLLERELSQAYARALAGDRSPRPPAPLQYRDYVAAQRHWLDEAGARQLDYWKHQLDGAATCWPMPTERPRESSPDLAAATCAAVLPPALCAQVRALAEAEQASAFMVMATAFNLVLAQCSGHADLCLGTPVASRRDRRFDQTIGLFANTVVVRAALGGGTFRQALAQVKAAALGAFSHQDLPFEQVVDALRPERSGHHPPLFQVLFALQSTEASDLALPGLTAEPLHLQRRASEFDLIFELFLSEHDNHAALTYRSALYSAATVERLQACFVQVLERAVADPGLDLEQLRAGLAAPAAQAPEDSAAQFLARHCALDGADRVLALDGLPAETAAAVRDWAAAAGAVHHACARSGLAEALRQQRPSVLALGPLDYRELQILATAEPEALADCRLVLLHGAEPGAPALPAMAQRAPAELWQCWGDAHSRGPSLLLRAGAERACHRGRVVSLNALGQALPADVIGELAQACGTGEPLRPTGLRGRLHADGIGIDGFASATAQVEPSRPWIEGRRVDAAATEAALARVAGVSAAAVLPRRDRDGVWRLLAYLVPAQKLAADALPALLREIDPDAELPFAFVAVDRLPRTRDGRLDALALAQCPAFDEQTLERIAAEQGVAVGDVSLAWVAPGARAALRLQRPLRLPAQPPQAAPTDAQVARADVAQAPLSLSCGAALAPPHSPWSLAALLDRAADEFGEHGVTYLDDGSGQGPTQSYRELRQEAARVAGGLRADGLGPGQRVLLQFADNRQLVTAFWGCVLCGAQPIVVALPASADHDDKDLAKIVNAWPAMAVARVLTSRRHGAHQAALAARLAQAHGPQAPVPSAHLEDLAEHSPLAACHQPEPDEVALLLLTSGSTGVPKAVMQSHRALISRTAGAVQRFGFHSGMVSLNWMPLDHVGGLVMLHLQDVYLGARQIQCATATILEQPLRWIEWMSRYRVNSTWAPNFAYALVNDLLGGQAEPGWDLSALGFIFNGGESVVPRTARSFLRTLAPCGLRADAMQPVWGMSETCSGTIFNSEFDLERSADSDSFVSVGRPLPGMDVRIVDGEDRLLPEGRDGRLQVRGALITSGYLNNAKATAESFTADGWYVTGDLAVLRGGALTITGREKDVIIVNGANYYGHEIEQVVESVEDVPEAHVAACGVRREGDNTDRLAIFYCVQERAHPRREQVRAQIARAVLARAGLPATYLIEVAPEELPRTSIGKIQRPQLAQRFNAGEFDARLGGGEDSQPQVPAWFFEPAWTPAPASGRRPASGPVLLLGGADPAVAALAAALDARGEQVHWVGEGGEPFSLADADPAHYAALLRSLPARAAGPWRIVHCGALDSACDPDATAAQWRRAQATGLSSLLALAKALADVQADVQAEEGGAGRIASLDVIARGAFAVVAGDRPVPALGMLQGLLRSLAQELPWLRCRQIDLDGDAARSLPALAAEIAAPAGQDAVAIRSGRRHAQVLREAVPAVNESGLAATADFAGEGLCLLTGGLGGVGCALADWLLRHTRRQVLVLGRSDPASGLEPERAEALQRLAAHGPRFAYAVHDLCGDGDLAALIAAGERSAGVALREVFHLAGANREANLAAESAEGLFAALAAKVQGARALHRALSERPQVEIVHFGSVNGYFGGSSVAAYSAANGFLEAIAARRRADGGAARCLAWSLWDETGMSRGHGLKPLLAARGFCVIEPARALDSFAVAMADPRPSLLIGLDPASPNIARRLEGPLNAWWRPGWEGASATSEHRDAFGIRFHCRDHGGSAELAPPPRSGGAEMTALQRSLASIWQDVLRVPVACAEANFFELGGDSIMAIQVVARAAKAGIAIAPRALFECQSLAELAATAESAVPVQAEQGLLQGEVPLSPTQAWFFALDLEQAGHMNQSALLRMSAPVEPAVIGAALEAVLAQHDMLRARFQHNADGVRQSLSADTAVQVQVHTLDYTDAAGYQAELERHCDAVQASLDLAEGPLLRAALLRGSQPQDDRLLLAVHHLGIDGVSWRILLEDFERACLRLEAGEPVVFEPKSSSYRQWVAAVAQDAASAAAAEEVGHWAGFAGAATAMAPLDRDGANLRGSEQSVEIALDAGATAALVQRLPAAAGVKIDDLLLAALQRAHARWSGADAIYLTLEGHGRDGELAGIDISRTVGWFTSLYPLRLSGDPAQGLLAGAAQVAAQREAVPQQGRRFNALRYLGADSSRSALAQVGWPAISFNYLGRFDVEPGRRFAFAAEAPGRQLSPRQQRIHEIDVIGAVLQDCARFSFVYCTERYDRATVQAFADAYAQALAALLAEAEAASAAGPAIPEALAGPLAALGKSQEPGRIERVFAATPMQTGLIYDASVSAVEGAYVSHLVNELSGRLDPQALRRAWQGVVDRHDVYRTGFVASVDGRYHAVVEREATLPWIELDWRGRSVQDQEAQFDALVRQDGLRGFDLAEPPLMRIHLVRMEDQRYRMLLSEHHAVSDGWSRGIVLAEVGALYRSRGEAAALPAPRSFADYAQWLAGFDRDRAGAHWAAYLQGLAAPAAYAGQRAPAPGGGEKHVGRWHGFVEAGLSAQLAATARSQRLTLSALVQAAWAMTVAAHTGSDDIAYLTTHSGRPSGLAGVESIVGPFIQTVPVRVAQSRYANVAECARALQGMQADRDEHGHMQLFEICAQAGRRDLVPAFHTFFVFENFPLTVPEADEGGLRVDWVKSLDRNEHPLMVMAVPGERLELLFYYRADLFDEAMIDGLRADFERALAHVAAAPQGGLEASAWLPRERLQAIEALRAQPRIQAAHALAEPARADAGAHATTFEF